MGQYTLVSREFPRLMENGTVVHGGTGDIKSKYRLVQPWTVDNYLDVNGRLHFQEMEYSVTVLSLNIDGPVSPNWFGVCYRKSILSFDSVNIFVHPSPGHAGMKDDTYQSRSGSWPRLFRYAEMLGRQMAAANSDRITIIPFFSNAAFGSGGIFTSNWKDLVDQILKLASASAQATNSNAAAAAVATATSRGPFAAARAAFDAVATVPVQYAPELKNVVLSNFSRGRGLMNSIRKAAPGLGSYLREVWDFDGNAAPAPEPSAGVRVLRYDQALSVKSTPSLFHVPPPRWVEFHGEAALKPGANVHSNIPDMLAWHTATVSRSGK